jgi:hypothetical protein
MLIIPAFALFVGVAASVANAVDQVPKPHEHGRARPVGEPAETPATNPGQTTDTGPIHDLDQQIKAMRDEFHSKLDPLQQQITALKQQYEPQLKSLEDKRHDLVEAGKPQAIQDLDRQEASELAALADKEKAEIERVRQQYAEQRRDVQARYKEQRERVSGKK